MKFYWPTVWAQVWAAPPPTLSIWPAGPAFAYLLANNN